jgi:alpha-mannosidase
MPFFPVERPARVADDRRAAVGPEGQPAVDTHPFHGFVDVSDGKRGLAVFARGLREYEVLPEKNQWMVALTLVRAVGWLSREDLSTRPGGAGPSIETPEGQCLRELRFEMALFPHGRLSTAEIAAVAEAYGVRTEAATYA